MSRAPSRVRQSDLQKTLKAAANAGVKVARIEVAADGKIIIVAAGPGCPEKITNEWDEVLDQD